jgi:hypothetical protein
MTGGTTFDGGCLCGELRYTARRSPIDAGYCHCRLCQRSSGAPALAWASFPERAVVYVKGAPSIYRSSSHGQREFCGACGCQIAYRESEDATTVDVNLATLDDPGALRPEYHVWTMSRIPWFDVADDLPRYADAGPDAANS